MNPSYFFGVFARLASSAASAWDWLISFSQNIIPGDWTKSLGTGPLVWISAQNAVKYSFTSEQEGNYARLNIAPTLNRPFVAEWDIEAVSDSWGNRHFGVHLFDVNNPDLTGYRLASFGTSWYYDKMVGQTSVAQTNINTHAGYPIPTGVLTVRIVALATTIEFYVNGVLLSTIADTSFTAFKPGMMLVGCELLCYEMRAGPIV